MRVLLRPLLVASLLLALSGCRTGRPDYTVNVPPNVVNVRPPRSVLFVDTPLRLDALNQALDQALLRALPAGGTGGGRLGVLDARWRLARQPATVAATAAGLTVRMPVAGEVSIGAGFLRCQSSGIGGVFTISVKPTLDPGGALVLAEPRVSVEQLGAISCVGVQVPLGELFANMLRPIEQALSAALGGLRLPLGPALSRGMSELAVPRAMDLDGRRVCLDLDPAGLVVTPLSNGGGPAMVRVGLDVAPRLSLGDCPSRQPSPPRSLTVRQESTGEPSQVQVAVAIPAADLQAPLAAAIIGKRFGSGQNQVQIHSLELGDASGRALIRVGVSGAYTGNLFLWGTPQVRAENGRFLLSVPDLQVASESSSRVQDLRLSLYQLFDGDLAAKLKPHLLLDITDRLQRAQQALTGSLEVNRSAWQRQLGAASGLLSVQSITLRSQLLNVVPVAVESRPGLIVAYCTLVGTLQLDIR